MFEGGRSAAEELTNQSLTYAVILSDSAICFIFAGMLKPNSDRAPLSRSTARFMKPKAKIVEPKTGDG